MLGIIALVLLGAWLLGVIGLYDAGQATHVLLLVGLMLGLIFILKSRDAGSPRPPAGAGKPT